jgi:hypothetical protein
LLRESHRAAQHHGCYGQYSFHLFILKNILHNAKTLPLLHVGIKKYAIDLPTSTMASVWQMIRYRIRGAELVPHPLWNVFAVFW